MLFKLCTNSLSFPWAYRNIQNRVNDSLGESKAKWNHTEWSIHMNSHSIFISLYIVCINFRLPLMILYIHIRVIVQFICTMYRYRTDQPIHTLQVLLKGIRYEWRIVCLQQRWPTKNVKQHDLMYSFFHSFYCSLPVSLTHSSFSIELEIIEMFILYFTSQFSIRRLILNIFLWFISHFHYQSFASFY